MKALKITIIALLAGFSMASCDFLDKEPTKLTPENYFNLFLCHLVQVNCYYPHIYPFQKGNDKITAFLT